MTGWRFPGPVITFPAGVGGIAALLFPSTRASVENAALARRCDCGAGTLERRASIPLRVYRVNRTDSRRRLLRVAHHTTPLQMVAVAATMPGPVGPEPASNGGRMKSALACCV